MMILNYSSKKELKNNIGEELNYTETSSLEKSTRVMVLLLVAIDLAFRKEPELESSLQK